MNDFEKLSEVDMNQIVNDLSEIVNPRAFISSDNLQKLSYLSHTKKAELYNAANDRPDFGDICLYKAAYNIGKSRFQKEAEYLMIRKGIKEYRRLQKEAFIWQGAKGLWNLGAATLAGRSAARAGLAGPGITSQALSRAGHHGAIKGAQGALDWATPGLKAKMAGTAALGVGAAGFGAGRLSKQTRQPV